VSELTETKSIPDDSPGATLHAERRRQNFSLGDVSRQLKLSIRQVEALESDEYQMFGGPVFVHGFLRSYAKLLGLDASLLIAAADRKLATGGEATVAEQDHRRRATGGQTAGDNGQKSLVPLFIAAAILIAGIAGWVLTREEGKPPEEEEAVAMVVQQGSADLAASTHDAPLTEPGAEVSVGADTDTAEVSAASAAVSAEMQQQVESLRSDTGSSPGTIVREGRRAILRFDFFEESWVEVTDRYGEVIYSDLNPAGVSQSISGYPPLSIVIGNAAGTALTYNDEAIDLAPHTRVHVARLTLD
jgi:cytoskeleton protein RodZ